MIQQYYYTIYMWYQQVQKQMIFSISGWRSIISKKDNPPNIPNDIDDAILTCIYYGLVSYIQAKQKQKKHLRLAIGCDARLSGIILLTLAQKTLGEFACDIDMLGMIPIPAMMAYTASHTDGFIYFTASHNPPEYNGIKFGDAEGKTQSQENHKKMMDVFYEYTHTHPDIPPHITAFQNTIRTQPASMPLSISALPKNTHAYDTAKICYTQLIIKSVFKGIDNPTALLQKKLSRFEKKHKHKLAVLWDPNGGARTWEGDKEILSSLGIASFAINTEPSLFNHAIIPEGDALQQATETLTHYNTTGTIATHKQYTFPFAVVCDCDGDRGNTIFYNTDNTDDNTNDNTPQTRVLEAQEVFAMILHIELAWNAYIKNTRPTAIAVNGPSSLRCNLIAQQHNAIVHRGEVGEANIVSLGEHLLQNGFNVPMVGEASNGGIIMFPSKVRDPLCTVLTLIKGLLWADEIGLDENLMSILSTLPKASTSTTEDPLAKFQLPDIPYKDICSIILTSFNDFFPKFQALFLEHSIENTDYTFVNFTGKDTHSIEKNTPLKNRITSGGLAVYFYKDNTTNPFAFIWLRPSGTEPVVRLLADILDNRKTIATQLLTLWRAYLSSCIYEG